MEDKWSLVRLLAVLLFFLLFIFSIVVFAGRIPLLGRLPGDFTLHFPGKAIFVPFSTSLLLSFVLTLLGVIATHDNKK